MRHIRYLLIAPLLWSTLGLSFQACGGKVVVDAHPRSPCDRPDAGCNPLLPDSCNACSTASGGPCRTLSEVCDHDNACKMCSLCANGCEGDLVCVAGCEATYGGEAWAKYAAVSRCIGCAVCVNECAGQAESHGVACE
jgi:hypothetical protein